MSTCHCDGPPHRWSPGWCPQEGPVSGDFRPPHFRRSPEQPRACERCNAPAAAVAGGMFVRVQGQVVCGACAEQARHNSVLRRQAFGLEPIEPSADEVEEAIESIRTAIQKDGD